jgi:hypothetical protein
VQLALAGGRLVSGEVRNLSLGGFAALVEQPMAPRTRTEVTLFDGSGAPLLFAIEAEVRRSLEEAPAGHLISVAFLSRGMVAMTLARLR